MIDSLTAGRVWTGFLVAGALGLPGHAVRADEQADRIRALERRLDESLKLIERLNSRLTELERAVPAAEVRTRGSPSSVSASQQGAIAVLQENIDQISKGLSQRGDDTGLPLHGFADVGGAWSRGADPVKLRGFNIGTLDLYLTPQFGDRVKSLVEIAFEYEEDGGGEVDLERLQLGYTVSDSLTLWAGRFHTPFGLWNTSFHHGANLQTSLSRPRFVEFEDKGGIIPAHSVGVWASGRTRLGPGKITYDGYLSNGPRIREQHLNFNAFTDDNAGKMLGGSLGYEASGALDGLTLGAHGFGSTVNTYASGGSVLNQTKLRMVGGYFSYDANDWEAIGEYYRFANADTATGLTSRSSAWFAHVGRMFGTLTPYVRYERAALSENDGYFLSQRAGRSYRRAVAGVRYTLDARSSLKVELSETSEAAAFLIDQTGARVPFSPTSYRRGAFQYSIAF
jgi:hypothetical protein